MSAVGPVFGDSAGGPRPRVLLVDDDEVNLLLTTLALGERGFLVAEARSGQEALEVLYRVAPDIVVLDAVMPELDGFATCERLRLLPGHENTPVLMLTGLDDDVSIARAYQAGATDFFVKAAQWSLLAGRLRYLLRAAKVRRELESSKAKLARAHDLARMGGFDWRTRAKAVQGKLDLTPEALRVFGMGPSAAPTLRSLMRRVLRQDRHGLLRSLAEAQARGSILACDISISLQDGRVRIVHLDAEPEYSSTGEYLGYAGIIQDVTDRRTAEDKIRHLANYDALTGLPNRRQLIWRTERALDFARQSNHLSAMLLVDLDRFKLINDTLGHAAGDEMLCEVARRLRACVRHSEQVSDVAMQTAGSRAHLALESAGRLGGDEFVVLLPEVGSEEDADRVAERILHEMRAPMTIAGQECFITASVGIALFPRDGAGVLDLLRNSDVAMYAAKAAGRNSAILYSPMMVGRGREKLELETALHKALERNELVLHYQPKIDVRSNRLIGVEALMRWQRGSTLVSPLDFIPLAEESGLIMPMTHWALHESARQAQAWSASFGFDESIAVNMPSRMIERTDLIEEIHTAVMSHNVPHRFIQLELTETGLMKDLQLAMPALLRLNDLGVEIAIDDFGTGYSSLAYLTSLPISELKIDRSFIRDLGLTSQSSAVVTAIIALSRSLGLRVVAEGVETVRQMEVLSRLGCHLMQGYLFARALPPAELEAWLGKTLLSGLVPWQPPPSDRTDSEPL